ncbi:MAG TPA: hypothetical protein VKA94_13920 [Hyphomicrobiales bacterium]|nr:hypothetical protein [Hyphomicrobiales bacterium]
MDNKVAKWSKWAEAICEDCGNVMLSRDMFLDLHRMLQKHPEMQQADYFHEYMRDTYIAHVTMMLRKHAKKSSNGISLALLASDMQANHVQVSGVSLEPDFDSAIQRFETCAAKVEAFADRVVAHNDPRPPAHTPTYNEIDEAIEAMDVLSVKCSMAVGGNYCDTCKPTVQYGWLNIFRDMGIET